MFITHIHNITTLGMNMRNPNYDDYIGNYAIKGKTLTFDTIAKQFYFTTIVPYPILDKFGKPYYSDVMHESCFTVAEAVQDIYGGKIVYAYLCSKPAEKSGYMALIPHGIVIKDGKIFDPINYNKYPDTEIPYLIPKKIRKPGQVNLLYTEEEMMLKQEDFKSLFPSYIKHLL